VAILVFYNTHPLTKMTYSRRSQEFNSNASDTSWGPIQETHPHIDLPLAFKVYCDKSRVTHSAFYIGREKGQKLHAISGGYKGWFKATVALHQGSSTDSQILGSAIIKGKTVEVTLPSSMHVMESRSVLSSEFAFDFPIEGIPAPEHFEWRRSQGPEVESLAGRGKEGWVLMRVGHAAELAEPVAAYSVDLCSIKLSGHFAFFNSGRSGELSADWVVMAIVTALSLGQKKRGNMNLAVIL
jgi:hypothetical protein